MSKHEIWAIYSTFATQAEAISVAKSLVEKRLIACANLQENITSIYRWQGAIAQEKEVALVAKTTKEKLAAAMEELQAQHSYQMPCIVAYPLQEGSPAFMQWVAEETA